MPLCVYVCSISFFSFLHCMRIIKILDTIIMCIHFIDLHIGILTILFKNLFGILIFHSIVDHNYN